MKKRKINRYPTNLNVNSKLKFYTKIGTLVKQIVKRDFNKTNCNHDLNSMEIIVLEITNLIMLLPLIAHFDNR